MVSAKSTATTLSADQASDIFPGRATTLPGAGAVVAIDQSEGPATRDAFYQKVVSKNAAQVKADWSKQIFSGKGTPPKDGGNHTRCQVRWPGCASGLADWVRNNSVI